MSHVSFYVFERRTYVTDYDTHLKRSLNAFCLFLFPTSAPQAALRRPTILTLPDNVPRLLLLLWTLLRILDGPSRLHTTLWRTPTLPMPRSSALYSYLLRVWLIPLIHRASHLGADWRNISFNMMITTTVKSVTDTSSIIMVISIMLALSTTSVVTVQGFDFTTSFWD